LIRLSEAIAKANCVTDVTEKFVLEAFDLLRQSIVTVERDDVDVDDEEEPTRAPSRHRDSDSPMADEDAPETEETQQQQETTPAPTRQRTKVTFEKFAKIQHMLATRIRDYEEAEGEGIPHDELIVWYTEQIEDEIDSVEQLGEESKLAGKVAKRMIKVSLSCGTARPHTNIAQDSIIMPIRGEGLMDEDDADTQPQAAQVTYVLHPNCGIFEDS
jgi:DNA replication licensing factor MCM6